jgi:hypothetical protein
MSEALDIDEDPSATEVYGYRRPRPGAAYHPRAFPVVGRHQTRWPACSCKDQERER